MTHKILFLVTSHTELGSSGKKTGIWAEEFILPYYRFLDAGFGITITSPLGGALPFDPASIKAKGENSPIVERFLADPAAQQVAASVLPAQTIDITPFSALFIPGGHGAMWDLATDSHAIKIVEDAFNQQKFIAAVCHGPAALVSAKRKDGRAIVENKIISAFTDAEESAAGLTAVVPFALESRLKHLGAKFTGVANWQEFAVEDDFFITGQNPGSTRKVADLLLQKLTHATEIKQLFENAL